MADLGAVFDELAARYRARAAGLLAQKDTPTDLIFVGPEPGPDGKEVWVGGEAPRVS